jgi:hypothetical protein
MEPDTDDLVMPGWEVYSSDGQRVGIVDSVEGDHLTLELEVLGGSRVNVPVDSVAAAGDGRVELDVPSEDVASLE